MKSIFSAVLVLLITTVGLEIALRIYNPIYVPLRANQIILPVNQTIIQKSPNNKKVDEEMINTYNGLGLRGPDYPVDPENFVKIFTVGGSTTACVTLSDGQTWPDHLYSSLQEGVGEDIWLNNAGRDGHSTFGHSILLDTHLRELKPDYILYLVGINDIGRDDLNSYDKGMRIEDQGLKQKITAASELLSTLQVFYRSFKAFDAGVNHHYDMDFSSLPVVEYSAEKMELELQQHRAVYAAEYRERVQRLIDQTKAAGATPILLTQPTLAGEGIDPTTGKQLATLSYHEEVASLSQWQILEVYNDTLRQVARENNVFLIDTAAKMPKDSKYYFDWVHYSNEGAYVMADIIAEELIPYLRGND